VGRLMPSYPSAQAAFASDCIHVRRLGFWHRLPMGRLSGPGQPVVSRQSRCDLARQTIVNLDACVLALELPPVKMSCPGQTQTHSAALPCTPPCKLFGTVLPDTAQSNMWARRCCSSFGDRLPMGRCMLPCSHTSLERVRLGLFSWRGASTGAGLVLTAKAGLQRSAQYSAVLQCACLVVLYCKQ
jgi:hypothetical protein